MNEEEVLSTLAHELGHWKFNHTLKMMIISQIHTFISFWMFGKFINWDQLYSDFGFGTKPTMIGLFLFFQVIMGPADHVIGFLMNILSRTFEFQADSFAKTLGYAEQLKTGLIKLNIENLHDMNPDKLYSMYHHSHPPLLERLKAIGFKTE